MNVDVVNKIADEIVEIVERGTGPVTLAVIHDKVSKFAQRDAGELLWTYEKGKTATK